VGGNMERKRDLDTEALEKAHGYFNNFTLQYNNPDFKKDVDIYEYFSNFSVAKYAAERLKEYGKEGLDLLESNGFELSKFLGISNDKCCDPGLNLYLIEDVIISHKFLKFCLERRGEEYRNFDRNSIKYARKVLSAYMEILPFEERVDDLRKLMAVDDIMREIEDNEATYEMPVKQAGFIVSAGKPKGSKRKTKQPIGFINGGGDEI
jgi:hypothetical protein